jgi:hypothetical protein
MARLILAALMAAMLFTTPGLAGESAVIFGSVSTDGTPLPGALITAIGESTYTSRNVTTDERGIYVIDKLPEDEYMIRALAQPEGVYEPGEANVFVVGDKEVNFTLEKTAR